MSCASQYNIYKMSHGQDWKVTHGARDKHQRQSGYGRQRTNYGSGEQRQDQDVGGNRGGAERPRYERARRDGLSAETSSIMVANTASWPLVSTGVNAYNVPQTSFIRSQPSSIKAYNVSTDIVGQIAKFVGNLLLVPRPELADHRGVIMSQFEGAVIDGQVCRKDRAADLAMIHRAAIHRIRDQMMTCKLGGSSRNMPKLKALVPQDECPLGDACIHYFYGRLLWKLADLAGKQTGSYLYHTVGTFPDCTYEMAPVPITCTNCTCVYRHSAGDAAAHDALADKVIAIIGRDVFPTIAWKIANKTPVSSQGPLGDELYSRQEIDTVVRETSDQVLAGIIGLLAITNLDSVSDMSLVSTGQPRDICAPLYLAIEEEVSAWKRSRETPGSAAPGTFPYALFLNYTGILGIPERTPVVRPDARALALERLSQAPEEEVVPVTVTQEVKAEAPVPIHHIGRRPVNGNRYVPRLVTDKFLKEEGFDFGRYGSIPEDERDAYVIDRLRMLFGTFVPNSDGPTIERLVSDTYNYTGGDPFFMFDCGAAYSILITACQLHGIDSA